MVEKLEELKQELSKEVSGMKDKVQSHALSVREDMAEVLERAKADSAGARWAVTTCRRKIKKDLLVVKACEQDKKEAAQLKSEVPQASQGTQITDS